MHKTTNTGFGIIEFVSVVAITGVLAAILIPTFAGLIKQADESVDMKIVEQMNKALGAEETATAKPAKVLQAKEILVANGCDDFTPFESTNVFYWIGSENRVILWNTEQAEVTYPYEYAEKYSVLTEPSADWIDLSAE